MFPTAYSLKHHPRFLIESGLHFKVCNFFSEIHFILKMCLKDVHYCVKNTLIVIDPLESFPVKIGKCVANKSITFNHLENIVLPTTV